MIKGVSVVPVQVSDQDAAIDFWVEKVGFAKLVDEHFGDGYRWVMVAPPGAGVSLALGKGYGGGAVGQFTGIVFEPDDLQATYDELSRRGVEFTEPPTPQPWGMQAQFVDQDGNGFVLVQS